MSRRARFTVIELLVCIAVMALLVALLVPALRRARERSAQAACISNVRDISIAIQLYHNDWQCYPYKTYLRTALTPYREGQDIAWDCPSTREPYEMFYVPRGMGEEQDELGRDHYFLGCPFHGAVNFAPARGTNAFAAGAVTLDGEPVSLGSEVGAGLLEFEDGSTARVTGDKPRVLLLASFRKPDGFLYSILRVFHDYGEVEVEVSVPPEKNSQFEVVTPAAIAGVVGTEFTVRTKVEVETDTDETEMWVGRGSVEVSGPDCPREKIKPERGRWWHKAVVAEAHKTPNKLRPSNADATVKPSGTP